MRLTCLFPALLAMLALETRAECGVTVPIFSTRAVLDIVVLLPDGTQGRERVELDFSQYNHADITPSDGILISLAISDFTAAPRVLDNSKGPLPEHICIFRVTPATGKPSITRASF